MALLKSKNLSDNDKSILERALMELTSKIVSKDKKVACDFFDYLTETSPL